MANMRYLNHKNEVLSGLVKEFELDNIDKKASRHDIGKVFHYNITFNDTDSRISIGFMF